MNILKTYKLFTESNGESEISDKAEVQWLDNTIYLIKRDCEPFIQDLKNEETNVYDMIGNVRVFYRGVRDRGDVVLKSSELFKGDNDSYITSIKKVRDNRNPKDMGDKITDWFDEAFGEKFGLNPRRKGVFVSPKRIIASAYADHMIGALLFFPKGDYKILYSKDVDDLFSEIEDRLWFEYFRNPSVEMLEEFHDGYYDGYPDLVGKPFDDIIESLENEAKNEINELVSSYRTYGLKESLESGNEITFFCEDYYLVTPHDDLISEFYGNNDEDKNA